MTAQPLHTAAPFFSLALGAWVPYALLWHEQSGEFRRVEGPRGFDTYREAVEASRFLTLPVVNRDRFLALTLI